MISLPLALSATALPLLTMTSFAFAAPPAAKDPTAAIREAALNDEIAWDITEGLTTEIGPRPAGTEREAAARAWSVDRLKALGFSNVRIEPYEMPVWQRGEERGEITAPFPQKLVLTALGNSGATAPEGLEAEVVKFDTLEALKAAPPAQVRNKIVFVSHRMTATQDGSSYGAFGGARRQGPSIASAKGAAAIVIRSIGTDMHRNPHAGVQTFDAGINPIPAAALSLPDAEQLERIFARGKPVRMKLVLTPRQIGNRQSGNVIAEVPGRTKEIVLVGCHLDSWDLGTGAIDDASGCGIVAAAAKLVKDSGRRPQRTIRVVWFGAEEVGLFGGKAYLAAHANDPHVVLAESDFGADRIWKMSSKVADVALPVVARLATALEPLGIARGNNQASGGSDIGPLAATGVPVIAFSQDGTRYFDYHHTPDDTLDKVDPAQLRQNVAAYAVMLSELAYDRTPLGPVPPTPAN